MSNNLPLVSIVAVNYNFERFVIAALNSIKEQTYPRVELIVIDDHSRDGSVDLIREWLQQYDKPYQLLINEKNLGVCATLNKAFDAANGKYISATATDDIYMPEKLSRQVAMLESSQHQVGAVYSDAYLIDESGLVQNGYFMQKRKVNGHPYGKIFEALLTDNFIPAMSVLLKASCYREIGHFDSQLVYEDYDFWLRLSQKYEFLYSEYISVKYRVKKKSLSTGIDWDLPNSKILIKHASHPKALKKLQELALKAYNQNKKEVMATLSKASLDDAFIRRILFLHRLRVPKTISRAFIKLPKQQENTLAQ